MTPGVVFARFHPSGHCVISYSEQKDSVQMGAFFRLLRTPMRAAALACALLVFGPAAAQADETYGFTQITNNASADVSSQLSVTVINLGAGVEQVDFKFTNVGSTASSITDIYFDDGSLLGIASITNGTGVSISQGASPGNLPGGNAVDFNTTSGFSADSDSPTQPNGVNPGEEVTIRFNLIDGQDYDDVIAALALGLTDEDDDLPGGLRIGIHVQGIDPTGNSNSFVNGPPEDGGGGAEPVPEPASIALALCGIFGIGLTKLRRLRRKAAATV